MIEPASRTTALQALTNRLHAVKRLSSVNTSPTFPARPEQGMDGIETACATDNIA